MLPSSFSTAIFWSDQQLAQLGDHTKRLKIVEKRRKIEERFERLRPFFAALFGGDRFERDELLRQFLWAWSCVMTRCVWVDVDAERVGARSAGSTAAAAELPSAMLFSSFTKRNVYAVAPFLDGINHTAHANSSGAFDPQTRCYVLRTQDRYRASQQVFIRYGSHSNWTLLKEYGFIDATNKLRQVTLSLLAPELDARLWQCSWKMQLVQKYGLLSRRHSHKLDLELDGSADERGLATSWPAKASSVEVDVDQLVPFEMLALLRLAFASNDESDNTTRNHNDRATVVARIRSKKKKNNSNGSGGAGGGDVVQSKYRIKCQRALASCSSIDAEGERQMWRFIESQARDRANELMSVSTTTTSASRSDDSSSYVSECMRTLRTEELFLWQVIERSCSQRGKLSMK
jgi:hypothetical protein